MYVFILMTAMLVAVIGISALLAVRVQQRGAKADADAVVARNCAHSAIELGLFVIGSRANWRNTYGSGVWIAAQPLGRGTLRLEAVVTPDLDVDLRNDPVVLLGIGQCGTAKQKVQVTILAGAIVADTGWEKDVD